MQDDKEVGERAMVGSVQSRQSSGVKPTAKLSVVMTQGVPHIAHQRKLTNETLSKASSIKTSA